MDAAEVEELLWSNDAYGVRVGIDEYRVWPAEWQGADGKKRTRYEKYTNPGEVSVRGFVALLQQAESLGLLPKPFSFLDLGCCKGHTCLIVLLAFIQCVFAYGIELARERIRDANDALQRIRELPGDPHKSRLEGNVKFQCGNVLVSPNVDRLNSIEVCWWADQVFDDSQRNLIYANVIPIMTSLRLLIVNFAVPLCDEDYRFELVFTGFSSVSWKPGPQPFLFYRVKPPSVDRTLEWRPIRLSARVRVLQAGPAPPPAVARRSSRAARPTARPTAPVCEGRADAVRRGTK
jgi:hypothetical protein